MDPSFSLKRKVGSIEIYFHKNLKTNSSSVVLREWENEMHRTRIGL